MLILNVRCKRCGGNLYIDRELEGDVIKCLACGFERDIPANSEEIKQEVIKVESFDKLKSQKDAIVAKQEGKTKGQLFYEKHAEIARLKTPWSNLLATSKKSYEDKANGVIKTRKNVIKPAKSETKGANCETKTANPETPVAQRLDAISNHLGAMDLVLTNMDSSLNDLNNRGYMDEAMKADIVAAAIEYFTGPGITKEDRGKKVLAIVQAIEGV